MTMTWRDTKRETKNYSQNAQKVNWYAAISGHYIITPPSCTVHIVEQNSRKLTESHVDYEITIRQPHNRYGTETWNFDRDFW